MSEVKYKDSGIDWIGEIPEDWKILSNKDILDTVYSGGTPETNYPELYYIGGIYPFTTISDFTNNGKFIRKTLKKVTERGLHNRNLRLVEKGTILYSIYASIGKVAICDIDTTISQAILALYYNDKQYSVYHYYVLESMYDYIQSYGRGGTQNNINKKIFENLQVPIPPLPTQHRIAEYLDKVIPNLDKQIESYEALSKKYNELKKSEIYECVTKGLPESRASRGYKDSGIEWIGEIPEYWSITRVNYIIDNKKGMFMGPFGSTYTYITSNDGEVPVFSQTNITNKSWNIVKRYVSNDDYNKMSQYHIKPNYLYLTTMGSVGYCMQGDSIKGLMDSHYIAVKLDNNLFNDKYFYYCYDRDCGKMGYDGLGKELHGATMDGINSKLLKKLRLPVPPIQEQQEIATYLDQKCTLYDSLSNLYQAKANKLKELKKSMIYEYVTGKKQVYYKAKR